MLSKIKLMKYCSFIILILLNNIIAEAQNVNTPNKIGPLGTQVNTLSGNLYIPRNDVYVPSRGIDINLTFYYNSFFFEENFGFGKGWTCMYSMFYKNDTASGRTIFWGDGREDSYNASGVNFTAPKGIFDKLTQYQPNKFLITQLDGMKYFFDNATHRKVTRMEEPNGNFLNFAYTDSLLTSITNTVGQTISLAYNAQGNLSSITDALTSPTRTYTYTYDGYRNLKQVSDPLGNTNKYTYLVNGPMKTISDKNNNLVNIIYYADYAVSEIIGCNKRQSFSYDTTLQVTTITDYVEAGNQVTKYGYKTFENTKWITSLVSNCCGYNMNFEFDTKGNKIKETDANGNITTYTYDANGNMLTMKDALNQTMTYTYTADYNDVASFTDAKGFTTTMIYDIKGNLTQLTEPGNLIYTSTYAANGDILSSTDPKGNIYTYNYDSRGNPTNVTAPNGYNALLGYDARGNLLSYRDARGNSSILEYDILDRLKKAIDPINNNVQLNYDAEGNPIAMINQNNETSNLKYDASNRLAELKDVMNNKTTVAYDAMDNIISVKDAVNNATSLGYDARNRLNSIKDAQGNTSSLSYDAKGNVTRINLPNGQVINYTYDALDRVKTITDANGAIAEMSYDKNDNIISYKNATGAITTAAYDSLNRPKQITDPLGNSMLIAYDKNSNVTTITDRNGYTKSYTYDSLNRVKTYIDNNGFVTTLTYDAQSNVIALKDQNNNTTNYTYDSLNRVKRTTYPDARYMEYSYNNKGNVIASRLTDATVINYVYDSLNRLITKTLPDGQVYAYTYDAIGRVKTATNNAGTVTLAYDELNRLVAETFDGRTTRYNYNITGRTQSTIYPDSTTITKTFNTRNNVLSIAKNSTMLVSYQYNNANQVIAKSFANGVNTSMQYDVANRLSNFSTGGGAIQNSSFTYDKEQNKTSINRLNTATKSEQYSFDNGYRLTNYKKGIIGNTPVSQNSYTYDALGNRTAANLNGTNTTYTSNNLNQLTNSNNGAQNINFTYDNNGNLTFDGIFFKKYDAEKRLLRDSSSPINVIAYQYDAFGRRTLKTINGAPLKYTYAGLAQIEERDGITNAIRTKTVFNNFLMPINNEKNGNNFYYHQNELNSVEAITNSNGRLLEKYEYDVYGQLSRYDSLGGPMVSSISGNRFAYTGQEYDSATNSYRFFFRNYSPTTGTFNQRDLIGYGDGMGMYQYVGNNPANGVDVFGLDQCKTTTQVQEEAPGEITTYTIIQSISDQNGSVGAVLSTAETINKVKLLQHQKVVSSAFEVWQKTGSQAAYAEASVIKSGNALSRVGMSGGILKAGGALSKAGPVFGGADLALKSYNLHSVLNDPTKGYNERVDATADVGGSAGNLVAGVGIGVAATVGSAITIPAAVIVGGVAIVDAGLSIATGKNIRQHTEKPVENFYNATFRRKAEYKEWLKTFGLEDSEFLENIYTTGKGDTYLRTIHHQKPNCPQNSNPGGTRKSTPSALSGAIGDFTIILQSRDPNAIIGPDGVPSKKWVSVKDMLPYTVLYENDKTASAPAKYVKIVYPIDAKQDRTSFALGNYGFNNLLFTVPPNNASYSTRLDVRDSLGLYVDVTAGIDVVNNVAFWEYQSIDPLTLLPPSDPLKGFLLLQDSTNATSGHGFVNFTIKPKTTDITLDTIHAEAKIVFDSNDTIPTNYHTNTVDAFAPISHMNALPGTSANPVALSWTGVDDVGGVGVRSFTLYVSTNGVSFAILKTGITRLDTTIVLAGDSSYCFFVLATDSVGNMETLRQSEIKCTIVSGAVLPISWLYFRGSNKGKNNFLEWATENEQNNKAFELQRSLTGVNFAGITSIASQGNSNTQQTYSYKDAGIDKLNSAVMYYRIKQIDLNGSFKYSNIVRLNYNIKQKINSIVYPNPTPGMITVTVGENSLIGTIAVVMDVNGRVIQQIKIAAQSQSINLNNFSNGTYFIRLQNKEVLRIIKQ